LIFGIPEIRLDKEGIRKGIKELEELGVKFYTSVTVGKDIDLEDLIKKYDAVLIATGTWKSRKLGIPGEDLKGVHHALHYIVDFHLAKYGYKSKDDIEPLKGTVAVIGGGFTAVDACHIAFEMGAKKVILLYRRTREHAPAGREFDTLEKMGVEIRELTQPVEFIGDSEGRVKAIKAIKMKLGKADKSGRPRPEPIPGSEHIIEVDHVLIAIGEIPTPPFEESGEHGIELNKDNTVKTSNHKTTRVKVFAAGDVKHGPSFIGSALKSGIDAAKAIDEFLRTGKW